MIIHKFDEVSLGQRISSVTRKREREEQQV